MSHTPTYFRLALLALCRRLLADQVPASLTTPKVNKLNLPFSSK